LFYVFCQKETYLPVIINPKGPNYKAQPSQLATLRLCGSLTVVAGLLIVAV